MKNKKAHAKNLVALAALVLVLAFAGILNRFGKTYIDAIAEPLPQQEREP